MCCVSMILSLQELIKESEDEQRIRREEILRRYAFYLFNQYKFDKSLKYFLQIKEGRMVNQLLIFILCVHEQFASSVCAFRLTT